MSTTDESRYGNRVFRTFGSNEIRIISHKNLTPGDTFEGLFLGVSKLPPRKFNNVELKPGWVVLCTLTKQLLEFQYCGSLNKQIERSGVNTLDIVRIVYEQTTDFQVSPTEVKASPIFKLGIIRNPYPTASAKENWEMYNTWVYEKLMVNSGSYTRLPDFIFSDDLLHEDPLQIGSNVSGAILDAIPAPVIQRKDKTIDTPFG